ncbi:MAG TPA: hypothetical protein VJZ25_03250, partial [Gemmatimonadaceae bacterium]|nr:hypothetical protein [Gemmatimonadaceae bacterium]
AHAAADACGHVYHALSRWVGRDGCHALFTRALAQGRADHPTLDHIRLQARAEPYVDGIAETITAHGDAVAAEALETVLARLVELLGRLIGDDMAMKLIERSIDEPDRGQKRSAGKRGTA